MLFESEISAAPPAGSTAKKNKYAQQSNFWIWSKINDHLIFLNALQRLRLEVLAIKKNKYA